MSEYKYILWDFKTGAKEIFSEATNRSYSYQLNRAGKASFTLPITSERLNTFPIYLGVTRLLIYRANVLIWAGVVWEMEENATIDEGVVNIQCVEIFHILSEKRYTSNTYTNTDAGQIAWGLINTTQGLTGGNLGLTQGDIEATQNRDRTYLDEKIGEKIIQLTEVINGFDFLITPSIKINTQGVFNVYSKRGQTINSFNLEYGKGLRNNIQAWSRKRTLSDIYNSVVVEGEGYGDIALKSTQTDSSMINAVGLLEGRVQEKSINQQTTLDSKGQEFIRVRKTEQPIYDLTLNNAFDDFGKYDIGDIVPVKIKSGYVNINTTMRIYGIDVRVSDGGEEQIKLSVSTII
jgi:hypothetical protein